MAQFGISKAKENRRSSYILLNWRDRRNTSSIIPKQDKKRNTSLMNELSEMANFKTLKTYEHANE